MENKIISLVPGPVSVPAEVLQVMCHDYGSGDLDRDFLELYNQTETNLQKILETRNQVIIQTGEGMWSLWGALKSCIKPGDKVVSVCTGVFGYGIADMAADLGAEVHRLELDYRQTLNSSEQLAVITEKVKPVMITAVHCETPSGTENPLNFLTAVKKLFPHTLICVDMVASAGGSRVAVDEHQIDLGLNGSQKALSAPPSMSFVSVSPAAWERIEQVGYCGYDAFLPFKEAQKKFYFPNTPYWHGVAALNKAAELILAEGLDNVFSRHLDCMKFCHEKLAEIGLELFPAENAVKAPTVTAIQVPTGSDWEQLNRSFRQKGLLLGGSYGKLYGKVFRIGHMGNQARIVNLKAGLEIIKSII